MTEYQLTRMRLTIDCAYGPQSNQEVSNEIGPCSANPFSPPWSCPRSRLSPPPREATLTSRNAAFQSTLLPDDADFDVCSRYIERSESTVCCDCRIGCVCAGAPP